VITLEKILKKIFLTILFDYKVAYGIPHVFTCVLVLFSQVYTSTNKSVKLIIPLSGIISLNIFSGSHVTRSSCAGKMQHVGWISAIEPGNVALLDGQDLDEPLSISQAA
jgi:hypothetical protein